MSEAEDTPAPKAPVDWESVEREYRAGQLSVVEIGRQHGVSHTAINKRAKKLNWHRDLTEKVRQEVSARLVSEQVSAETRADPLKAKEAIEIAATRGVELVRQHRGGLDRLRKIAEKLATQLDADTDDIEEIEEAIEEETAGDKGGERRARMLRAVSLGSRAGIARELSQVLKNLLPLERQAFNLQENSSSPDEDVASKTVTHKLDPASAALLKRLVE